MGIITFILVICLVVGIHEMGHYLACRSVGVKVNTFSIGIGPRLCGVQTRNTLWKLSALPIGGYISMDEADLERAKPWQKAWIAVAGPLINLAPFLVLGFIYLHASTVWHIFWGMYVSGIEAFTSILLHSIDWFHWIYPEVASKGHEVLSKGHEVKDTSDGAMGVVGMGSATSKAVAAIGVSQTFIVMFSLFSIGLAMFNLIPMPPLDGGRIVLAGVEQVAGKAAATRAATILGTIGVVLVIWLLIVITFHDVAKLF